MNNIKRFLLLIVFMTIPQVTMGIFFKDFTGTFYAIGFIVGMIFEFYINRDDFVISSYIHGIRDGLLNQIKLLKNKEEK